MVIALIRPIIVVAQQIYRNRNTIYKVLTAQDKYIARSMKAGGYGRQASYGVRSGALAGSIIGSFLNNADDTPGNGVPKPIQKRITPSKPYKTRGGRTERNYSRYSTRGCYGARSRNSRSRKY